MSDDTDSAAKLGRPVLPSEQRKNESLRFRISTHEMRQLQLAGRLCGYPSRSAWALSRLQMLSRSVIAKAGVDPADPAAVLETLRKIEQSD